ncbi:uncharacterized protein LOC118343657 [Juglans regia]|uniref:Uncharacterized protein LOC118343657 n=1 Tax=Juglans regia TaxID=51240 RepID=A0A2I4DRV9_JUGRE|nr:uncharacterized protein LOC118343657 [Juglans regia]
MAKAPVKISTLLLMSSRRSYSVAVENARVHEPVVTTMRKAAESGSAVAAEQTKEIFWMRDPKSGNWIPESHFDDIDVAELREKLLPRPKEETLK